MIQELKGHHVNNVIIVHPPGEGEGVSFPQDFVTCLATD